MKRIIISEVISQAWELTKKHWLVILACAIIMTVVQYFITAIMGFGSSQTLLLSQMQNSSQMTPAEQMQMLMQMLTASMGATIVSAVVSFVLSIGFYQTVLNCARGNGQFTLDAWKQAAALYVKIFLAQVIFTILVYIGFLFCILPGIYLAARLQFTVYYMLDNKDCDVLDGIKASWRMTENDAFTLIGLALVYIGLYILGLLCCCVGVYVSMIVVLFGTVVCYFALADGTKAEPKIKAEPKSDSEGYNKSEKA
ncbi:MAG: hypothetical protein K6E73_12765 [Bacteroidales bacterium]|nr:hypothetical protein [Bacteroidales bacterium]